MIRLVTRGDDAGSCRAANRAVATAARDGVLRNASLIACGPATEAAAALLKTIPDLCIGLHLTLASEWDAVTWGPLTKSALLTDPRGVFPPTPAALPRTDDAIAAMLAEADAQLARLKALGLEPAYVDEHMAVSSWAVPELRAPLAAWAAANGLLDVHGVPGVPGDGDLLTRLEHCPPGDYVFVNHPGYNDAEMRTLGNTTFPGAEIAAEREADRLLWLDPALAQLAAAGRVAFVRYTEIV